MRSGVDVRFADFSGGLNVRDSADALAPNETPGVTDFVPDGNQLIRRPGDVFGNANTLNGEKVCGMVAAGDYMFIFTEATGRVYRAIKSLPLTITFLGAIGVNIANSVPNVIKSTLTGGQGEYFITAGNSGLKQTTGFGAPAAWTAASGTLPTTADCLLTAGNRVWLAGLDLGYALTNDPGSTLIWSDINNPRAYPAANVTMFAPNDGERIVGIHRVGDGILVVKPSRCWFVYDLDTSANREVGFSVGYATSWRARCETPVGLIGINPDRGLLVTNGSDVKLLDDRLLPIFRWLYDGGNLWRSRLIYCNDSLYFHAGMEAPGTIGQHVWEFDMRTKSWWHHMTAGAADICSAGITQRPSVVNAIEGTAAGGYNTARLFESGNTRSNGAALVPIWQSPHTDLGERARKRFVAATLDVNPGASQPFVNAYDTVTPTVHATAGPISMPSNIISSGDGAELPMRMEPGKPFTRTTLVVSECSRIKSLTIRTSLRGRR